MSVITKAMVLIAVFSFIVFYIGFSVINLTKLENIKKGKKSRKKNKELFLTEAQYLYFKYKINKSRVTNRKFALIFAFINASIMALTVFIIQIIPIRIEFGLIIGFVFLIGLIYSVYGIMGSILVKKGYQNEL